MRLDKKDTPLRVEPRCQPIEHHLMDVCLQLLGDFKCGQGVDIDDAVDTLVVLLEPDIVLNSTQVIANYAVFQSALLQKRLDLSLLALSLTEKSNQNEGMGRRLIQTP